MKKIEDKIHQLIDLSNQKTNNDWTILSQKSKEMEDLILEIRNLAFAEQTILGRIILFPYDDKFSYYLITEINNDTVTIECLDLYEGFVHIGYDKKCDYNKIQAECYIRGVDCILKMFPKISFTLV